MSLTKTIAEIKEALPRSTNNLSSTTLLPNFDVIEEKYLVPIIGTALYNDLVTKYEGNTLSADEKKLVKFIRVMTAAYGYLNDLPAMHVLLTDQGARTANTGNLNKAVGWEYKELKGWFIDKSLDGTEALLLYLWSKKADLALWTASDEYKQFEGLLIKTGTDFSEQYKLYQPMRTFYSIITVLKDAQKEYIVSAIGADLLSYLVKKATPTDKEEDIINELKKGLAFFTIKQACDHKPVRISDSGFTIISEFAGGDRETDDSGRGPADANMIKRLKDACDRDGKRFVRVAKKLAVALRAADATDNYKTAYDAGPLAGYVDPADKTTGNETRKMFRF